MGRSSYVHETRTFFVRPNIKWHRMKDHTTQHNYIETMYISNNDKVVVWRKLERDTWEPALVVKLSMCRKRSNWIFLMFRSVLCVQRQKRQTWHNVDRITPNKIWQIFCQSTQKQLLSLSLYSIFSCKLS